MHVLISEDSEEESKRAALLMGKSLVAASIAFKDFAQSTEKAFGEVEIVHELLPKIDFHFDEELHKRAFQHKKRPLTEERKQWKKKLHKLMRV